jgi:putative phosphoribosyl transferase
MQPDPGSVEAGRRLAAQLRTFRGQDAVVLGVPRNGLPVAYAVAQSLGAPLDFLAVRKLVLPFHPDITFGAVAEDGVRVVNESVVEQTGVSAAEIAHMVGAETADLERQVAMYRPGHARIPLDGRVAVIVDSDLACGATAAAACRVARGRGATRIVIAAPVGSAPVVDALREEADDVVCPQTPPFYYYATSGRGHHRHSTSDAEVVTLLDHARQSCVDVPIRVVSGTVELEGDLTVPENPCGIIVFAHGSGSSRHSPRNRYVARVLNGAGFATLLFDLLTRDEEADRANVFAIGLLRQRLIDVTRWLGSRPDVAALPIGYFGASTGAGAALAAAADIRVHAVVSRGGRPDLAGAHLARVTAPTLLIVGGRDTMVLDFNRRAQAEISGECTIAVVPGAGHLFEEPGTLEQVAVLARDWFLRHVAPHAREPRSAVVFADDNMAPG